MAQMLPEDMLAALMRGDMEEEGSPLGSPGTPYSVQAEQLSAGAWQATLAKARRAVVVVKMEIMCDPEGGSGGSSQGTGFVVDAERGLIVTNRHIGAYGLFCECSSWRGGHVSDSAMPLHSGISILPQLALAPPYIA